MHPTQTIRYFFAKEFLSITFLFSIIDKKIKAFWRVTKFCPFLLNSNVLFLVLQDNFFYVKIIFLDHLFWIQKPAIVLSPSIHLPEQQIHATYPTNYTVQKYVQLAYMG